jgi:hypothetical protein
MSVASVRFADSVAPRKRNLSFRLIIQALSARKIRIARHRFGTDGCIARMRFVLVRDRQINASGDRRGAMNTPRSHRSIPHSYGLRKFDIRPAILAVALLLLTFPSVAQNASDTLPAIPPAGACPPPLALRGGSVFFTRNSARIEGRLLDYVVGQWRAAEGRSFPLLVEGHIDFGEEPGLDEQRLDVVVRALVQAGVPREDIWTRAVGTSAPDTRHDAPVDVRLSNQRVRIVAPLAGNLCREAIAKQYLDWMTRHCIEAATPDPKCRGVAQSLRHWL